MYISNFKEQYAVLNVRNVDRKILLHRTSPTLAPGSVPIVPISIIFHVRTSPCFTGLSSIGKTIQFKALIDTGANGYTFLNIKLIRVLYDALDIESQQLAKRKGVKAFNS